MRKGSKVLVFLFFAVAMGLIFVVNKMDAGEIETAIEERIADVLAEREQQQDLALEERQRSLEARLTEQEKALADSLAVREQALARRLAQLDSLRRQMEEPIYSSLRPDQVAEVLTKMGLEYEQGTDNDGDPKFDFRLATYEVTLFFYGCEAETCTSLRLYAGFSLNTPPTVDLMNEWNNSTRYGAAYVNGSEAACLDNDLILLGGVTLGAVEAFILNFRDRVSEFAEHIDF